MTTTQIATKFIPKVELKVGDVLADGVAVLAVRFTPKRMIITVPSHIDGQPYEYSQTKVGMMAVRT